MAINFSLVDSATNGLYELTFMVRLEIEQTEKAKIQNAILMCYCIYSKAV